SRRRSIGCSACNGLPACSSRIASRSTSAPRPRRSTGCSTRSTSPSRSSTSSSKARASRQADMSDQDTTPTIYAFDGQPSEDGRTLLVNATAFDGRVIPFAIPVDNVKHFIAFLLAWVGTMSAGDPVAENDESPVGTGIIPIPATSIAIGEPSGQEGYI